MPTPRPVLDKGSIDLVDFMGGDLQVVNSARVSFGKRHVAMQEGDDKLINFLLKHRHGTPFESSAFTFHVKCPISVAREWLRHRIGSFNEISGRYVLLEPEFYVPLPNAVRAQKGKAGSYTFEQISDIHARTAVTDLMVKQYKAAYRAYEKLIEMGVAKELARNLLPVGIYTEFYWTVNARSMMNFLSLRNEPRAMHEIQQYAVQVEDFFNGKMPVTCAAFTNNGRIAP